MNDSCSQLFGFLFSCFKNIKNISLLKLIWTVTNLTKWKVVVCVCLRVRERDREKVGERERACDGR